MKTVSKKSRRRWAPKAKAICKAWDKYFNIVYQPISSAQLRRVHDRRDVIMDNLRRKLGQV